MLVPCAKVKGERGGTPLTRERLGLLCGVLACAALALGLVGRSLERPGLNYDEVIQAEPALWFLRAEPAPPQAPGVRSVRVLGRPLPWMTQPYMGALKSQVLVPVFALAHADAHSLRLATLGIALLGLVCAMAFTFRLYDLPTALLLGSLLALDPSFLFTSRHDWGSFALGFLLRSAAALTLLTGWRARDRLALFAGGLCAGLSVYNKIDGVVPLAAAGAALLLAAPGLLREMRPRAASLGALLAGFGLGAAPMLAGAVPALVAARALARAGAASGGEWAEKLSALHAVLDGSYFHRLMLAGGSFERLADVEGATATPFLALFLIASLALALWLARDLRRGLASRPQRFALLAALFALAGVLLTPRAVRIHHFLNAWPLPHLVVAVAAREAWRRLAGHGLARAALALALAAALLGALRADLHTFALMRDTGGRGRWSDALERLAPELARQGAHVVCLDWGFAGPLRFTSRDLAVDEPIWRLRSRRPPRLEGGAERVYLLYEAPYAVFPFGSALLDALAALPPDAVTLRRHADRRGDTAFVSLRFAGPHRLDYRGGRFEVQLR